jgi:16S rRNA (adenine1518-N6/adenine1519-N6)-dimethyltransferase
MLKGEHKAKKSLGQNFLKSIPALNAIILAGEIKKDDIVLEIGPGKGALTEKLLEKSGKVIAIEKDKDLLEILQEKFKEEIKNGKFVLINEDVLNYEIKEKNYKIIANIPYNITGAILKKFLTSENQPEKMVLMVQNEVAKRIVAKDGDESILSISVKAYGNPKIVMKVPARYFSPAPKVDSAIIAITNISRETFNKNNINEGKFWELVKNGFAHKRKVLVSNLKDLYKKEKILEIFEKLNISEKTRAEDLTLENWIAITKML